MELSKDGQSMELILSTRSATSYQDLLEAQKNIFQTQIVALQNIVATQCKLTGVNPLSQEMAAGALSIKIGKRPRDLLNPKAIKYMQFVFSIKDAVSKRETREISAQFGVTATQVREFFTGQRSRVRNFIRLSGEKTGKSCTSDKMHDGTPSTSDLDMAAEPIPIDTIPPSSHEDGLSLSMQPEVLFGKENPDKHFMDHIFRLMRSEESFSGQVKLLEWILQMGKISVLQWFLAEGGVMILATWISQAAMEEQTSVLHVILKVLCHLPLRKALPVHMSAVLQSVNRLRFYRAQDISNRARILLSRWSKMFANSQNSNKLNGIQSVGSKQDEMLLKQSINEVMGKENWDSDVDNSEATFKPLSVNADNIRKLEFPQKLKFLTAPGEESSKRRGVLSSQMRERRKVKMVEPLGQRGALNNPTVAKLTPATQSRPLSADDIQKAKMRAQFMQSKYGKNDDTAPVKSESQHKCSSSQSSLAQTIPKSVHLDHDEQSDLDNSPFKVPNAQEAAQLSVEEPPWKKYKRIQNTWRPPPEGEIRASWLVGAGESSKEVEFQKNRIRREREVIYRTIQEIPSNPREPWDCEMDYDDSLTPEIPIEQLPDVDPLEMPQATAIDSKESVVAAATATLNGTGSVPEPDLELLAELLKNPEIVFALTSGQAGDVSSNETLKLLDMIKVNGITSLSNLAGLGRKADNKVEVSLPSPTPPTEPALNVTKPDFLRNPFSRQRAMTNGGSYQAPGASVSVQPQETIRSSTLVQPHNSATSSVLVTHPLPASSLQSSIQLYPPTNPNMHHRSSNAQHLDPEMMLSLNTVINSNRASSSLLRAENFGNINPPTVSMGLPLAPAQLLGRATPTPLLPPKLPLHPKTLEPTVSSSLGARPGYESINYQPNNSTQKNYNVYNGRPVQAAVPTGNWEGKEPVEKPEFESWSPDSSPRRHYEYEPAQKYNEHRVNLRYEYGLSRERQLQRNVVQHSAFRDHGIGGGGNKRSQGHRRLP